MGLGPTTGNENARRSQECERGTRGRVRYGQAIAGGPIEGDASGGSFLNSHIREDYATLLSTLDERRAIVFGRAGSCRDPVLVRPNKASKSPGSFSSWTRFRGTNETGETCLTAVTGVRWRWSDWSGLWKALGRGAL